MHTFNDYIRGELRRGYSLENDDQKYSERRQKYHTFIKVPYEFEQFMFQAYFQIVDAFLFVFTLLPIRFLLSCWFIVSRSAGKLFARFSHYQRHPRFISDQPTSSTHLGSILQPAEICDLLRGIILIFATILISYVDTSILYHNIKSQSWIKLYIFFNMLEVFDKLLSTFGCDALDALFWTATEPASNNNRGKRRIFYHLMAAVAYVLVHGLLVLLQATTLNVALNSKNNAMLAIMMSNNFVELKGMVFKKFEKNNLFHMSCSDARERHHLLVLLMIVMLQTMKQYNWSEEQFYVLLPDCLLILGTEIFVDWLKHSFVTRFNEIGCEVYREYAVTLAYDLVSSKLKRAYADHSDLVSRRMGFIPLPLAVLVTRVCASSLTITSWKGYLCILLCYLCLLTTKIIINLMSLGKSCEIIEQQREQEQPARMPPRQCASLPSSRHASTENVPNLLHCISQSHPKSQPQSPRASLADITVQAQAMQENLEQSFIFSDSTVSLNKLDDRHDQP